MLSLPIESENIVTYMHTRELPGYVCSIQSFCIELK